MRYPPFKTWDLDNFKKFDAIGLKKFQFCTGTQMQDTARTKYLDLKINMRNLDVHDGESGDTPTLEGNGIYGCNKDTNKQKIFISPKEIKFRSDI